MKLEESVEAARREAKDLLDAGKLSEAAYRRRLRLIDSELEAVAKAPILEEARLEVCWRPVMVGWTPRGVLAARAADGRHLVARVSLKGTWPDKVAALVDRALKLLDDPTGPMGRVFTRILAENPDVWGLPGVEMFYGVPHLHLGVKGLDVLEAIFDRIPSYRFRSDVVPGKPGNALVPGSPGTVLIGRVA